MKNCGWFPIPKKYDRFELQWGRIQNLIYQVCDHTWLDLQKWKLHISMVLQRSWQIFQIRISLTNKSLWQNFISKRGLSSTSCVSFHKSQCIKKRFWLSSIFPELKWAPLSAPVRSSTHLIALHIMKLPFSVNSSPSSLAVSKSHQRKFPLDILCSVNLSSLPSQYNWWWWWCQSCFMCHMSSTKYACGSNFIHGELFIHQACGCSHSKWSCTMIDSSSFWNSKLNSEPNWGQHMWLIAPPFKTLERKVSLHPLSDGVWLVNSQREANLQFLENTISTTAHLSQTLW